MASREEENELAKAIAESVRLAACPTAVPHDVQAPTTLEEFRAEYNRGARAALFQAKATLLARRYATLRRVRGDGNCFYRSFWMGWIDRILSMSRGAAASINGRPPGQHVALQD